MYLQTFGESEMQSIKVIGEVNAQHRLVADVPESIPPGEVEVLLVVPSPPPGEDDAGREWSAGVAREWKDDLADPRQDIYTLADGVPVDEPR
jgi:hypothetical protein